jgi:predicted nucleic acid-binding protein
MYLLDTNILLEFLLDQENANDVEKMLQSVPPVNLYISEFSLYSIGVIMLRRKMHEEFIHSLMDLFDVGGIRLLRLGIDDMDDVVNVAQRFNLDFDDAYQYAVAEKYILTLVSYDRDFDGTDLGRTTPAKVLDGSS